VDGMTFQIKRKCIPKANGKTQARRGSLPCLFAVATIAMSVAFGGTAVSLRTDLADPEGVECLWESPGVASLWLKTGAVAVVEARFGGKCHNSVLSLPVAAVGTNTIELIVSEARLTIRAGSAVDEDFPTWPPKPIVSGKARSERVRDVRLFEPTSPQEPDARPIVRPIQFWTPDGFNTSVGDVAVCSWKGRFHVFYLKDRRHHGSKGGAGGHEFAHLSSADLVHWVEHPTAVRIENLWETVGTGTPFELDGKLCLAYGWHTERFPMYKDKPVGGAYSVSDDGIRFVRANKIFTESRNPTVFNLADGRLGFIPSYGGKYGLFVSDHLGDWQESGEPLPEVGSSECPAYFEWNGWRYLLRGFWGMAACAPGGTWEDWSRTGKDIYGGLSVPMVGVWKGNRRIIVGWIRSLAGWGGWLCLHEIVQLPNGRLGEKWLPEATYPVEPLTYHVSGGQDLNLSFGRLRLSVDAKRARASFVDVDDTKTPQTIAEILAVGEDAHNWRNDPPHAARSYAIGDIPGLDRDYDVRVVRWYDAREDATVFDVEIAGVRTMLCRRSGRVE